MKQPGQGMGGAPGSTGSATAEENKTEEMTIKGRKIKVPDDETVKGLLESKLDFDELKRQLENKFPGYTLPSKADIESLKLEQEHVQLKKIVGDMDSSFTLVTAEEGAKKFDRDIHFGVSGNSLHKKDMNSSDKTQAHLTSKDFIFLVKKTSNNS